MTPEENEDVTEDVSEDIIVDDEVVEEVVTSPPPPPPASTPPPTELRISLDKFRPISGVRPEYFGGFRRYIELGWDKDTLRQTVAEWKQAYRDYLDRPVVG